MEAQDLVPDLHPGRGSVASLLEPPNLFVRHYSGYEPIILSDKITGHSVAKSLLQTCESTNKWQSLAIPRQRCLHP